MILFDSSLLRAHETDNPHPPAAHDPPQSTPVSSPFCTPSSHVPVSGYRNVFQFAAMTPIACNVMTTCCNSKYIGFYENSLNLEINVSIITVSSSYCSRLRPHAAREARQSTNPQNPERCEILARPCPCATIYPGIYLIQLETRRSARGSERGLAQGTQAESVQS